MMQGGQRREGTKVAEGTMKVEEEGGYLGGRVETIIGEGANGKKWID